MSSYNPYQQVHYTAMKRTKQKSKPCLWDLKYRGENVSVGVPYPVAVKNRTKKIMDGWDKNAFTITKNC